MDSLDTSLARGLFLHFQPIVAAGGRVIAAEALARRLTPDRETVSASNVFADASLLGYSPQLDRWAVTAAMAQHDVWLQDGLDIPVHVNVAAGTMGPAGGDGFATWLAAQSFDPGRLTLELTEASRPRSLEQLVGFVSDARRCGVTLALDSFGTAYATLGILQSVRVQMVKIDRSLIGPVVRDGVSQVTVRNILGLAHELGMRVIAEGVETREHLAWLSEHGCDAFQGFACGMPMAADEFATWMAGAAA